MEERQQKILRLVTKKTKQWQAQTDQMVEFICGFRVTELEHLDLEQVSS